MMISFARHEFPPPVIRTPFGSNCDSPSAIVTSKTCSLSADWMSQILIPIDGRKLTAASGHNSLNSRNSSSTSCSTVGVLTSSVSAQRKKHEYAL
jgi:hypothetical protein